jgi:anti-sigma regulatory factor (Ser/Thr protein kinase)
VEEVQTWQGPAEPATVRVMRHAVVEFARVHGFDGVTLDDLRTCVSEAVTNAVMHGFRDDRPAGTVAVSAQSRPDGLLVRVSDDGIGFAPRTDSPGLGLGIPTIVALTASMSVGRPTSGGTELRMTFERA